MQSISSPNQGRWIAVEGADGCGKTIQLQKIAAKINDVGLSVVTTKEPGGAPILGPAIRDYLFKGDGIARLSPEAQLLFFEADRAATVESVILPSLGRGQWVLCDRGPFGSLVYQGIVQNVPLDIISRLNDWATGGRNPDLTVILDVSPDIAVQRLQQRAGENNWFDRWGRTEQVCAAYKRVAEEHSERCILVPADDNPDVVTDLIWREISVRFNLQ